jgi:hypothetical protein
MADPEKAAMPHVGASLLSYCAFALQNSLHQQYIFGGMVRPGSGDQRHRGGEGAAVFARQLRGRKQPARLRRRHVPSTPRSVLARPPPPFLERGGCGGRARKKKRIEVFSEMYVTWKANNTRTFYTNVSVVPVLTPWFFLSFLFCFDFYF